MKSFLNFETKNVLFQEIDTEDRTFVISTPSDTVNLKKSIEKYGIINIPYIARSEKSGYYRVVCGHRRIKALSEFNQVSLKANIFGENVNEAELVVFSILDNLSHRTFNIVEKAAAVEKLIKHFPRKVVIEQYLSLIGAPPTETCVDELVRLSSLEPSLKEGILKNIITDKTAVALSSFSQKNRDRVFELFSQLNLSASKQAEFIENLKDISLRDSISITTIIQSIEIQKILSTKKLNRSQKTEQIRQTIRKIRYPVLSSYERRFSDIKSCLDIAKNTELIPPPFFEGDTYRLQISFKKPEELAEASDKAKDLSSDNNFKKLFMSIC